MLRDWRRRILAVVILLDASILLNYRLNYVGGVISLGFIKVVPMDVRIEKSYGGIDFMIYVY